MSYNKMKYKNKDDISKADDLCTAITYVSKQIRLLKETALSDEDSNKELDGAQHLFLPEIGISRATVTDDMIKKGCIAFLESVNHDLLIALDDINPD